MKALFDSISIRSSRMVTKSYSTSFSLGILGLDRKYHDPIYAIYGFVRFADEIVDSFEGYPQKQLLERFWKDTYQALEDKISLNPILNSFQQVVHAYEIDYDLIETFLKSMEMDLYKNEYDEAGYKAYILGSAEVVGLMCLKVFVDGNQERYLALKEPAMQLGSAFQKINFLRDLHADSQGLIWIISMKRSKLALKQILISISRRVMKESRNFRRARDLGCTLHTSIITASSRRSEKRTAI